MSAQDVSPATRRRRRSRIVLFAFRWLNPVAIWAIERLGVGRGSGVLHHRGRKTGREYATPLCMVSTPEGYIVPAAFGPRTDWLANLKATPESSVVFRRETHATVAEVIDLAEAIRLAGGSAGCPCWESGIDEFVLLRPTSTVSASPRLE